MKDKYFLDTNIFIYTFDAAAPAKQKHAQTLVNAALIDNLGVISYQVVQEFLNVATRKFQPPMSAADAKLYLEQVFAPLCEIYPSMDLYEHAIDINKQTHFAFYDSLMIAAAIKTGCKILYSEDLHHQQSISGLVIKNPFSNL